MEVEEYTLSQSCLNEYTKNSFAELIDEQDNINFLLKYFLLLVD